jgi:hypothetical protein
MKETYYFTHDYNARSDSKIKNLIRRHQMLGYGIYWAIIEDLYQNANALPLDYEGIAFDLHTDKKIVESVINDFDLFVKDADSFGSLSVQRRLNERNEKSKKARLSALERWNKNANALPTQSDSNAIKESKEEEKKEDEKKFNFSQALLSYGFDKTLVSEWLEVRRKKKAVNTETAYKGFITEVEKTNLDKNKVLKMCVEKSWQGFTASWITEKKAITPPNMERMKNDDRFL